MIKILATAAVLTAMAVSGCADKDTVTVTANHGRDGRDGVDGKDGRDGVSCYTEELSNGVRLVCPGSAATDILNGERGADGQNGQDGSSCTVSKLGDVATITCSDGSSAQITDGQDGSSCTLIGTTLTCGSQSISLAGSVSVVRLSSLGGGCKNAREVFLIINGKLYGAMNYKTGNNLTNVALEEITNGTYQTTDNLNGPSNSSSCKFKVNGLSVTLL